MFGKIKFYLLDIVILIAFGTMFWMNFSDRDKTTTLIDVENKKEYSISFGQNSVVIDDVEYYVNIDQLRKNLDKAKELKENDSIVSSLIVKDDIYNKYDIITNDGKAYIIFYKFVNEYDDTFDSPMFELNEFSKIFKNLRK